jgi:hypothetical protein
MRRKQEEAPKAETAKPALKQRLVALTGDWMSDEVATMAFTLAETVRRRPGCCAYLTISRGHTEEE